MKYFKILISQNSKSRYLDYFLWLGFFLWLIIDTVTGYFLNLGTFFPLSQIFKMIMLILLVFRVSRKEPFLRLTFLIILYLAIFSLTLILHGRSIAATIPHILKLISTIYIYVYLTIVVRESPDVFLYNGHKVITIAFIILSINIGLGLFNIGFHTYPNERVGYKGFFFAGNELGGVIASTIPFVLYLIYLNCSRIQYILISIFILILSYILSTKSVMLICFTSILITPWVLGNIKTKVRVLIMLCVVGIPIISFLITRILSSQSELVLKLIYSYNTNGILGLIFSGRDEFLLTRGDEYYAGDISTLIMGIGESVTVELDLFDSLLNYGIIGILCNIYIIVYLQYIAFKNKKNNSFVPVVIYQNWLIIFMSIIAGHIVYSSMAGLYIALTNSFVYIKNNKKCLIRLT